MDNWAKLSSGIASLNIGQNAGKFAKGFGTQVQQRFGAVAPEDITELPLTRAEYKDLEARVDALRAVHLNVLRITKTYESETYDYPTQIQESLSEFSTSISHTVSNFAASNLKGTSLPAPPQSPPPKTVHKTLPHALSRTASSSAATLSSGPGAQDEARLIKALGGIAAGYEKVGEARLSQDDHIRQYFLQPWQATLNTSIAVAMKARQAVKVSRLELDSAKQGFDSLKNAAPTRQEQARLEVENAEDDLVQKTEVAISMMKAVLENPEPLKNLNELIKAQLIFYSTAAEALSSVQGELEELSVAAEGDYRYDRPLVINLDASHPGRPSGNLAIIKSPSIEARK
ncbi:cytoplasmic protein [Rhizoctonia solani AG-1 IA]|uniref:Cytoplasmic protein n=1 Tax=Thanatephorus cucumeris (strain AG1-IA) TaxID=983506 RepID=L8WX12_THACA|nr:cytoplasmic protein [Rhizoctonia solani AG-1 IA]